MERQRDDVDAKHALEDPIVKSATGRILLEETLQRFPEWHVHWDRTQIVHTGSSVRGYSHLPVQVK